MTVELSMFSQIIKQPIQDDKIQNIFFNEKGNFIICLEKSNYFGEQSGDSYLLKPFRLPPKTKKAIAFSSKPDEIFIEIDNKLFSFNYKNGQLKDEFSGPEEEFLDLIALDSKKLLLNVSGKYKGINVWDLNKKSFVTSLVANIEPFHQIYKLNNDSFVTISYGDIKIWDYNRRKVQPVHDSQGNLFSRPIHYSSVNSDLKKVVTIGSSGELNLIDLDSRIVEFNKKYDLKENEFSLGVNFLNISTFCIITNEKLIIDDITNNSAIYTEDFANQKVKFAGFNKNIAVLGFENEFIIYRTNR